MSKRSSNSSTDLRSQQPSKPSGSKSVELPRSVRPSHVKSSSAHTSTSRRNSEQTFSPKLARSDDDNNSTPSSPHTSARESEPATDETSEQPDSGSHHPLEVAERQAVAMLNKITEKSERNHQKYNALHDSILGKDKQVDELHASLEDFIRQTVGLEALCNSELDSDTLDKLFMRIPSHQRQLYIGE